MRAVVAPDSFGGTLDARSAAAAIADGWRRIAPADALTLLPLADGGTGFVDVLHAALGGTWNALDVAGPLGVAVPARWLRIGDTAYVESAAACGLQLVPQRTPDTARRATTRGVGELIADARDAGVREVVVGLGGSATTDGGAGMLAALGSRPVDTAGVPIPDGSPARVARFDRRPDLGGVSLVAAADVDNPLLGRHGAAAVFGPQKGADPATIVELDAALDAADLVVTGEGSFDWQSLRGKLVTAVARAAADRGVPCVVLAGQVSVGRREAAAVGVDAAYSVSDDVGGVEASPADPAGTLAALAGRVATRWSR